jgi:NAD-dependent SIR2 family protein deacetylase
VYVIVNQGPTAHDQLSDLRIEGDATVVLPEAVRALQEKGSRLTG